MASPGHCRNILDPNFSAIGIGVVPGPCAGWRGAGRPGRRSSRFRSGAGHRHATGARRPAARIALSPDQRRYRSRRVKAGAGSGDRRPVPGDHPSRAGADHVGTHSGTNDGAPDAPPARGRRMARLPSSRIPGSCETRPDPCSPGVDAQSGVLGIKVHPPPWNTEARLSVAVATAPIVHTAPDGWPVDPRFPHAEGHRSPRCSTIGATATATAIATPGHAMPMTSAPVPRLTQAAATKLPGTGSPYSASPR
jgi:hypothetical protein